MDIMKISMDMVSDFATDCREELSKEYSKLKGMFEEDNQTPPSITEFVQLKFISTMVGTSMELTRFITSKDLEQECSNFLGKEENGLSPEDELEKILLDSGISGSPENPN